MIDNIHLSRIRSNFLRTTSNLIDIWDAIEMIAKKSSEGDVDQNMLDEFKTIKNIVNATEEELQNVANLGKLKAKKIRKILDTEYKEE